MAILQLKSRCSHCGELADFVMFQASEIAPRDISGLTPPLWEKDNSSISYSVAGVKPAKDGSEFCALSRCPNCGNPVMFVVATTRQAMKVVQDSKHHSADTRIMPQSCKVMAMYPPPQSFASHPSWPEEIRKPFVEMQDDLSRGRTPAFIITGCRTILDVATKQLGADGKNIFGRIEDLRSKGLLTGALADWAHEIRQRGADAVHDLDGDRETARQFVEFIKLFLHVAYELPEMINARKPAPKGV